MTFIEIDSISRESQGFFAPERLASDAYSRRFYSESQRRVITVYVAAVISDNEDTFYPESITEIADNESDPLDVSGDDSDFEYDSDISYTNFETAAEAEKCAVDWLESLSPDYFS